MVMELNKIRSPFKGLRNAITKTRKELAAQAQEGSKGSIISATDLLCEGPIYGLVNGAASVYLNNNAAENGKIASFSPFKTNTVGGQTAGTITFSNSTTGTIDANTVLPPDLVTDISAPRKIYLDGEGDAKVAVTMSNFQDSGETKSSVTLTAASGGSFSTSVHTTNIGNRNIELEFIYADGTRIRLPGNFSVSNSSSGTFIWSKANGALDQNSLPEEGFLRVVRVADVTAVNLNARTITTDTTFNGTFGFKLTSQFTFESGGTTGGTFDPTKPLSKISQLHVQENVGTYLQKPLTSVGSVGGQTTTSGSTSGVNLVQLKMMNPAEVGLMEFDKNYTAASQGILPSNTYSDVKIYDPGGMPNIAGYTGSETAVPGSPDYTDTNNDPTILNASDFGLTSATKIQSADKVSFNITYPNGLYFIQVGKSTKQECYAFYDIRIEFQESGSTVWQYEQKLFNGQEVKHKGATNSATTFQHIIELQPFSDINYTNFRIKIFRVTRHKGGLPIHSSGTSVRAGKSKRKDKSKWSVVADSQVDTLQSTVGDLLSYPYTAHVQTTFSSRNFATNPTRTFDIRGKLIKIPNGYVPREASPTGKAIYPTFWDGSFSEELFYTDNPAWILLDILTNERYGAGSWVSQADIDIYALFRISKFCDELVDTKENVSAGGIIPGEIYKILSLGTTDWNDLAQTTGVTYAEGDEIRPVKKLSSIGTGRLTRLEPRFRMNLLLTRTAPVYKVVKDMCSMFLGMMYWSNSKLTPVQDLPQKAVASFSKANVIGGDFSYESSSYTNRTNQVIVQWNNPAANYALEKLIIEDSAAIVSANKLIREEVTAFGCTSESQAKRYGKWKLFTAQNQNELVSFSTALEGRLVRPGDVINIHDTSRQNFLHSGRVSSATSTTITFDREVLFTSGNTYEVIVQVLGGSALYAGADPISINSVTYNSGAFIPQAYTYESGSLALTDLDTEQKASNAMDINGNPISIEWKPNFKTETLEIVNPATTTNSVTLANSLSFSDTVREGVIWSIRETSGGSEVFGSSKLYRVIATTLEEDKITTRIEAIEQSVTNKFLTLDEEGEPVELSDEEATASEETEVPPPEFVKVDPRGSPIKDSTLVLSWRPPSSYRDVDHYDVTSTIPERESFTIKKTFAYFRGVESGTHNFAVRTVSTNGDVSEWVPIVYDASTDDAAETVPMEHGVPKCGNTSSKGAIRRDFVSSSAEKYSRTSPEFYVKQSDISVFGRTFSRFEYVWNDQVVKRASSARVLFDLSGDKYDKGSQQVVETPNSSTTDTFFAIKSTSTAGSEGAEVFEFENYPVTISSCADPERFFTISSRSPNGFVDLSGVVDNDPRELYVYFDASVPKIFLAEWDVNANGTEGPPFWRDANQPMTDAWTSVTGSVNIAAGSSLMVGTGTSFLSDLEMGDTISLANLSTQTETLGKGAIVNSVVSDTVAVIDRVFSTTVSVTNLYKASFKSAGEEDTLLLSVTRPT